MNRHSKHAEKKGSRHSRDEISFQLPELNKDAMESLQNVLMAVAVLVLILGQFFLWQAGASLNEKLAGVNKQLVEAEEAAKPAELELVAINAAGCPQCFDMTPQIGAIRSLEDSNQAHVSVKTLDPASPEAQSMISAYSISKLPVFIVKGETTKSNVKDALLEFGTIRDDNTLVLDNSAIFPHYDLGQQRVVGIVNALMLEDSNCADCTKASVLLQAVKGLGVFIGSESTLDYRALEGKAAVQARSIQKLPSIVLSGDAAAYQRLTLAWKDVGTVESNGEYVWRNAAPPLEPLYYDLNLGRVVGYVDVVYLTAPDCNGCYDPHDNYNILKNAYGVKFDSNRDVEYTSQEGRKLIADYNIAKVPTVLLTGDVNAYWRLDKVWPNVGHVALDGTYIQSKPEGAQWKYLDLATGNVVNPQGSP